MAIIIFTDEEMAGKLSHIPDITQLLSTPLPVPVPRP